MCVSTTSERVKIMDTKHITIKEIKELLYEGLSYSKIADKLGVSKNVVIGRMSRYIKKGGDFSPSKKYKNIKHQIEHFADPIGGMSILELKNDSCRYMIGEHRYCGHDVTRGSYCTSHAKECYVRPTKRWR